MMSDIEMWWLISVGLCVLGMSTLGISLVVALRSPAVSAPSKRVSRQPGALNRPAQRSVERNEPYDEKRARVSRAVRDSVMGQMRRNLDSIMDASDLAMLPAGAVAVDVRSSHVAPSAGDGYVADDVSGVLPVLREDRFVASQGQQRDAIRPPALVGELEESGVSRPPGAHCELGSPVSYRARPRVSSDRASSRGPGEGMNVNVYMVNPSPVPSRQPVDVQVQYKERPERVSLLPSSSKVA